MEKKYWPVRFSDRGITQVDIISEIYDLEQKGLIDLNMLISYDQKEGRRDVLPPDKIGLTALGRSFCELLSLKEIGSEKIAKLNEVTRIIIR
jgi:hypothetical protein